MVNITMDITQQCKRQGPVSVSKRSFLGMEIPIWKIRLSRDRLIFDIWDPYIAKTASLYWDGAQVLRPQSIRGKNDIITMTTDALSDHQ